MRRAAPPGRLVERRGFDASVDGVAGVPLDDFGVIQFSAHARADDRDPELAWIALSRFDRSGRALPGLLRPARLAQLRLNGSLVVLAGCDTGLGAPVAGEGLLGLTGSVFQAGAAQVVVSLARIDAEAASAMLSVFYREMFGPGRLSAERALTKARQEMAASNRWSDPFHWASLIVAGRPGGS